MPPRTPNTMQHWRTTLIFRVCSQGDVIILEEAVTAPFPARDAKDVVLKCHFVRAGLLRSGAHQ